MFDFGAPDLEPPFPLKITVLEVIFCESSTLNEFDILLGNHGNKMFRVSLKYS